MLISETASASPPLNEHQFDMQINQFLGGIKELLGSDHPVLESCAKYFFELDGGKKIRPTMVLAVSYALNAQLQSSSDREDARRGAASPSQRRLAEITEMIHTASLFHDDVLDKVLKSVYAPWCCCNACLIDHNSSGIDSGSQPYF
jgi:geranylgeranyl pyrophosphate synthase